jgi:hypothetical protein
MKILKIFILIIGCIIITTPSNASIPEPDTLIYGKVFNTYQNNAMPINNAEVELTIRKKAGTKTYTYQSNIECLQCTEYKNGECITCENYSYIIKIPQEVYTDNQTDKKSSLNLSQDKSQFDYVEAKVNGKLANILPKSQYGNIESDDKDGKFILVGQPRRCHIYQVDLELVLDISDKDNDGLPDFWEEYHSLDSNSHDDANLDNDNDGWTNFEEFNHGTNPTKSNTDPQLLDDTIYAFEGGKSLFRLNIADSDTSDDNILIQFDFIDNGIGLIFYGDNQPYEHGHILEHQDTLSLKHINEGNVLLQCSKPSQIPKIIMIKIFDEKMTPNTFKVNVNIFLPTATNATDAIFWADAFHYANEKQEGNALPKRIVDRSGNENNGDFYTGTEHDQNFSSTEIDIDENTANKNAVINQNGYFELPYASPVFPDGNVTIISAFRASGTKNQILASGPHYEIGVTGNNHPLHPGEFRVATESNAFYSNIPVINDFILATTTINKDKTYIEINGLWTGGPYPLSEKTKLGTDPILGGKVVWEWDFRDMAWIGHFSDIMEGQFAEMIVYDRVFSDTEKWPIYAHFLTKWFDYIACDFSYSSKNMDIRSSSGDKSEKIRQRKLDADQAWLAYSEAYFNNSGIEEALHVLESYLADDWQWTTNPPDVDEALSSLDSIKYDYQNDFVAKYGKEHSYIMVGGMGNDTIIGGYEDDFIIGGPGDDKLIGCHGKDVFVVTDGDTVIDFNIKDGDVLYLNHLIDNNGNALNKHIHFELGSDPITTENHTLVMIDSNGDGSGFDDAVIVLKNVLFRDSIDLTRLWSNGNLHTANTRPEIKIGLEIKDTESTEITEEPAYFNLTFSETNLPNNLSVPLKLGGSAIIAEDYKLEVSVYSDELQNYENQVVLNDVIPIKIKPGDRNIQVKIIPIFDSKKESDETIYIELLEKKEYYDLSEFTNGTFSISDGMDEVVITSLRDSVIEDAGVGGKIEISRKGSLDIDKVVHLMLQGTAENGKDYQYVSAEVTIPAGELKSYVYIAPYRDNEDEQIEFAEVIISNGDYKVKGPASARVSIRDPNAKPEVLMGDIDDSNNVNLKDAILCLQILKSEMQEVPVFVDADINLDNKLGLAEVIYILQKIAYENTNNK